MVEGQRTIHLETMGDGALLILCVTLSEDEREKSVDFSDKVDDIKHCVPFYL
jgi:hypothetical protein